MDATITTLPGDGIGPEVTAQAVRVLSEISKKFDHTFRFQEQLIGGVAMAVCIDPLPEETLAACLCSDAILLGAVGDPRWDNPASKVRPEQGLLRLRKSLEVFANIRPLKIFPALAHLSPIKPEKLALVDFIVVRELTGGIYFGQPRFQEKVGEHIRAVDTMEYFDYEIERVARLAFELASDRRKKVTLVDKANVLETSRLWRQVTAQMTQDFPNVQLETMLVDTAAMRLVSNPAAFDIILTENMFGDILTDEAAVLTGSMGLLPSASLGKQKPGIFEPIHGSAPDIAGKNIANPVGAILSGALLLRDGLGLEEEACCVEQAVEKTICQGYLTRDLGGNLTSAQITDRIIFNLYTGVEQ